MGIDGQHGAVVAQPGEPIMRAHLRRVDDGGRKGTLSLVSRLPVRMRRMGFPLEFDELRLFGSDHVFGGSSGGFESP